MAQQNKGSRKVGRNFRVGAGEGHSASVGSVSHYVATGGPGRNWRRNVRNCTRFTSKPDPDVLGPLMGKRSDIRHYLDSIRCSVSRPCPIHVIARERVRA